MNFKGIYDSASEKDIFLVNTTRNMAKPKIISKVFGITMRNLNDKEISSLASFINFDLVKFFNVTKTTDNTMNFLKNVDGLYDFYTESDKNVDGSIKALKNVTGIGKNSKVFSIFDKYGTKTVKTIEDVVGLIGG